VKFAAEKVAGLPGWLNRPTVMHRYARGVDRSVVEQSEDRQDLVDRFLTDDEWIAIGDQPLSVGELYDWAVRADCGAVVVFSGTIRDHSLEGSDVRSGVEFLDYEAYTPEAIVRMRGIVAQVRATWPTVGRIAMVHRIGRIDLGESSVLVVVSAPHRPEAFEAARYAIDALKSSVPIWKHETWDGGSDWGVGAQQISAVPHPNEDANS
jgi:molybdopterin synthase catalytic subunit